MPSWSDRGGWSQDWSTCTPIPARERPGDDLDDRLLRADLQAQLTAGVTLVRAPGLAGDPPGWFGEDVGLPRAVHAGRWIAQPDQFVDGWGRRATARLVPAVAAEQAARTGWAKVIGDWREDDPALSAEDLLAAVRAVHAVGGRLAVHAQTSAGAAAAARAGVDSIEHGQGLDPELLPAMADSGVALTPTLTVIQQSLARRRAAGQGAQVPYVATAAAHAALAVAAAQAGVTVLAGTDSRPHGRIADEIRSLHEAGMSAHDALGAGSWTARTFLGLPGLLDGAPADAVVYLDDPRTDLRGLDRPAAVVLRGRLVGPSTEQRSGRGGRT